MGLEKVIGQAILKEFAPQGLPFGRVFKIAQSYGGTYRRTDMLKDYRAYTGRVKYQSQIVALSSDAKVPKGWMVETELAQPTKYRVFGSATYYDWETDTPVYKTVSIYTNDWSSEDEYAKDFEDYITVNASEEDLEFINFQRTGQEHNIGWDY